MWDMVLTYMYYQDKMLASLMLPTIQSKDKENSAADKGITVCKW